MSGLPLNTAAFRLDTTRALFDGTYRHAAGRVRDLDVAAGTSVSTVEMNTHTFAAGPWAVQAERRENELVDMITRHLLGGR
ncbi:hypothetical protein OG217_33995 [Streptomyces sp. NBC_01023]|uniref:hypothetical protein n=1 Tax=Streptomyces sp. NBC_01023 TaxID=2903724 RepID=UPI00386ABE24|nr:hypothetical protein OG217_33995 [Streptomyces sp. NBC_01023]